MSVVTSNIEKLRDTRFENVFYFIHCDMFSSKIQMVLIFKLVRLELFLWPHKIVVHSIIFGEHISHGAFLISHGAFEMSLNVSMLVETI